MDEKCIFDFAFAVSDVNMPVRSTLRRNLKLVFQPKQLIKISCISLNVCSYRPASVFCDYLTSFVASIFHAVIFQKRFHAFRKNGLGSPNCPSINIHPVS
jgi:hypothetical protein